MTKNVTKIEIGIVGSYSDRFKIAERIENAVAAEVAAIRSVGFGEGIVTVETEHHAHAEDFAQIRTIARLRHGKAQP